MSTLTRSLSTRIVRKLEKPKPLKNVPGRVYESHIKQYQGTIINIGDSKAHESPEDVVKSEAAFDQLQDTFRILDLVSEGIQKNEQNNILQLTNDLVQRLRNHGSQLEDNCLDSERIEKIFETLRSGINEVSLDSQTRLNLLQIVELRASRWLPPLGFFSYYNKRSPQQLEFCEPCEATSDNEQQFLGPGEVLKSSGKYGCPLKIPGKNYCKDEVVIRNSDSGKVMGIKGRRVHMIEELSETIISFQRVNPGAKERLVQITGPNETKIMMARQLIEDTIKRNASPVREVSIAGGTREVGGSNSSINSSASDESSRLHGPTGSTGKPAYLSPTEYRYSVRINDDIINISSTNLELLNDAKILLDSTYVDKSTENNNNNNEDKFIRSDSKNLYSSYNNIPQTQGTVSIENLSCSETVDCSKESDMSSGSISESAHSIVARNNSIITGMKKEYSRQFLLDCSTSKASLMKPYNWDYVINTYPAIVKEHPVAFDAIAYQKRWLENEVKLTLITINSDEFLDSE